MDIRDLKEEILNRELISDILAELGCHHVRDKGDYIQAGNKDGDNPSSIVVYKNEYISCINYTRQITKNGRAADIFDLIAYTEDCSFAEAMKFVCGIAGIDYYGEKDDLPESLQILRMLKDMSINDGEEDSSPAKPISEKILSYYLPYGNKMFEDDGISLEVQHEFGVGFDPQTNRITIPIRTPLGDLCGVKGRLFGDPDDYNPKYLYLEPTAKQKLLYGLYENKDYIKHSNYLIIFEAEKSVLQCASNGVRNCVAIGGKSISKTQAELIIRTGCTPIVALDKGIELDEIKNVMSVFPDNIPVYYIFDEDNIMRDKQSPVDDWNNWEILIKNNVYKK
jgi:DNA primase